MSTRSSRSGRRKKPNPALYVGYVEDDETPEMIMKKFAEMERIVSATKKVQSSSNSNDKKICGKSSKAEMSDSDEEDKDNAEALSEAQLVSLFNDTSYYSINSLQRNNDCMFQKQTVDEDGFVIGIDDPNYEQLMFEVDYNVAGTAMADWGSIDEDNYVGEEEFWDDPEEKEERSTVRRKRSTKDGSRSRSVIQKRERFAGHNIGSSSFRRVCEGDGDMLEKVKICHEPCYLKVPNYPIPRSWLKSILPYDGRSVEQYTGYHYLETDIVSCSAKENFFFPNNPKKVYRAILMDPPFDLSESPVHIPQEGEVPGTVKLDEFRKIPMRQIVPEEVGCMLFIWVPSELTMQVNDICTNDWGFVLVEHATWIMRNLAYQIENRESNLLGISKHNLLLFRRVKKNGKTFGRLELRHQRTSDSYFDFVRYHSETGRELKSDYAYKVIETMLPDLDKKEDGCGLYLWAPKNEKRDGWTCITDTKYLKALESKQPNMDVGDW